MLCHQRHATTYLIVVVVVVVVVAIVGVEIVFIIILLLVIIVLPTCRHHIKSYELTSHLSQCLRFQRGSEHKASANSLAC